MSAVRARSSTWLENWEPENESFWEREGKQRAWRTLQITTANLTVAFSVWFLVSVLAVKLNDVGFGLSTTQLFWLTAMPGLAGGTLRIIHTFLVPIAGTRIVVAVSTALLLIPLVGWFFAVQDPDTPYWVLLALAFLCGLGGGNFSSFMPSTSLFFPKRLQGTALGLQAGIGNFGVSLVQFVTPWVIGFALVGSAQVSKKGGELWLQNAALDLDAVRRGLRHPGLGSPEERAGAGQRPRAVRHLPREAHLADDVALLHDLRLVRRLLGDVPADDQEAVRRLRRRTGAAQLRVPGAARRLRCARRRRPALGPLRRRPPDDDLRDRIARLLDRRLLLRHAELDRRLPGLRRLHARAVRSSPASATPPPSSRCRRSSRRGRRAECSAGRRRSPRMARSSSQC